MLFCHSRVLYTTTFEILPILGPYPIYFVFIGLLLLLQVLHYFWFYLICQVAISACKAGKVCSISLPRLVFDFNALHERRIGVYFALFA